MALRQLAVNTVHFGLRWQVPCTYSGQLSGVLGAAASRAFATVEIAYRYAKSHEWVKVEGDVATVGISDFAQAELGEVVYVELPDEKAEVTAGETFGVVESVKAASDVYSPISGTVVTTNASILTQEPGKVNSAPYTDGWLIKVQLSDKSQLDTLLDAEAYKASLPADSS